MRRYCSNSSASSKPKLPSFATLKCHGGEQPIASVSTQITAHYQQHPPSPNTCESTPTCRTSQPISQLVRPVHHKGSSSHPPKTKPLTQPLSRGMQEDIFHESRNDEKKNTTFSNNTRHGTNSETHQLPCFLTTLPFFLMSRLPPISKDRTPSPSTMNIGSVDPCITCSSTGTLWGRRGSERKRLANFGVLEREQKYHGDSIVSCTHHYYAVGFPSQRRTVVGSLERVAQPV